MRHVIVRLPLKNETYDGYSKSDYHDYDKYIGDHDNVYEFVNAWLKSEGIPGYPYEIMKDIEMNEENSDGLE
jgi:hypothetical protein